MNAYRIPDHKLILGLSILVGCIFIAVMSFLFMDTVVGVIVLDSQTDLFPYPLTIQNIMHLIFFVGLGEIYIRWRVAQREQAFLRQQYLPEDDETVLQSHDLGPIRKRVSKIFDSEHGFLPSLIDLCILQFQSTRSIAQVVGVLNSSLDLINHRVDLRYTMLRYISWVIPTFGFIGTVVGIAYTLGSIEDPSDPNLLTDLTSRLGVSFNTTIVALSLSAILVLLVHITQRLEERSVNHAGHYTLRNLINRLYTGSS